MYAVVSSRDAGDRVQQHKYVFACLDHAPATLDHEAREPHVRLQVLIVGRGDHLGLDRPLEVGDFLGAFVNEQHHHVDLGVVGGDGVGYLLEDRGFAGAGRGYDQAAGAFAQGRDHINDSSLDKVGAGFQLELLDRVNGSEILEADGLGVVIERHAIDLFDGLELGTVAPVRRLGRPCDQAAFPQETAFDRIGRDENVRRFRVEMILGRTEESEALFGDLQVARPVIGGCSTVVVTLRLFAHTNLCVSKA